MGHFYDEEISRPLQTKQKKKFLEVNFRPKKLRYFQVNVTYFPEKNSEIIQCQKVVKLCLKTQNV